eukprot:1060967-Pleurochrysis_carterae.AAC.1
MPARARRGEEGAADTQANKRLNSGTVSRKRSSAERILAKRLRLSAKLACNRFANPTFLKHEAWNVLRRSYGLNFISCMINLQATRLQTKPSANYSSTDA